MDVLYFFNRRLEFIRQLYDTASAPYVERKRKIEAEEEPFVPPYSEDAEPAFLEEWIPGSWWPLALMMAIFFIKYATGYAFARNLAIALQPWFVGAVSLSLGLLSGAFLARAGAAWNTHSEGSGYA